MTWCADLLAPDAALPLRDELLDRPFPEPRLLGRLGLPDVPGSPVTRLRAKYQPGRSLRVVDRLVTPSGNAVVSTRMVSQRRWPKLAAAAGAPVGIGGDPPAVAVDERLGTVSWLFPADRRLETLGEVWARTPRVTAAVGAEWARSRLVGYAPEKAATLACVDVDGRVRAYLKVYPTVEATADAARRAGAAVAARDGARAVSARVRAVVPALRLVVMDAVEGTPLADLPPDRLPRALSALGASLAALHRLPAAPLPASARFTGSRLAAAAQLISAVRPDVEDVACGVASALARTAPAGGTAFVHGDARLANALMTRTGVTLVDLDQAAGGHPAEDLGSVLAGLRRARLVGALDPSQESELTRHLLDGYLGADGRVDEAALTWHLAASLLTESAARAVSRLHVDVLGRLEAVLHEAAGMVDGADPLRSPVQHVRALGAGR